MRSSFQGSLPGPSALPIATLWVGQCSDRRCAFVGRCFVGRVPGLEDGYSLGFVLAPLGSKADPTIREQDTIFCWGPALANRANAGLSKKGSWPFIPTQHLLPGEPPGFRSLACVDRRLQEGGGHPVPRGTCKELGSHPPRLPTASNLQTTASKTTSVRPKAPSRRFRPQKAISRATTRETGRGQEILDLQTPHAMPRDQSHQLALRLRQANQQTPSLQDVYGLAHGPQGLARRVPNRPLTQPRPPLWLVPTPCPLKPADTTVPTNRRFRGPVAPPSTWRQSSQCRWSTSPSVVMPCGPAFHLATEIPVPMVDISFWSTSPSVVMLVAPPSTVPASAHVPRGTTLLHIRRAAFHVEPAPIPTAAQRST